VRRLDWGLDAEGDRSYIYTESSTEEDNKGKRRNQWEIIIISIAMHLA
jgi:hypothetical protein